MNRIEQARTEAAALLLRAYEAAAAADTLPRADVSAPQIEAPKDQKNGDWASSFAMQNAKTLRLPPRKVAEAIAAAADLSGTPFAALEIAGPGFLNLRLAHGWFEDVLRDICAEGKGYGCTSATYPEKIMVEFVSANPTGPMHMGNARGGVLGDTLAEVLSRAGNDVTREFYVNDAGNQIEKFALSLAVRYEQLLHGEDSVTFPEDGYHGDDIRELAAAFREEFGDDWLTRDKKEFHDALVAFGLKSNLARMKSDLRRYQIEYDVWFFESTLHETGYVADTVEKLTQNGWTYEKDDALWLRTSALLERMYKAEGKTDEEISRLELKDDVLCRANGIYTYFAADIAYHRNKFEVRGFDRVINIWGADHHGHVNRLKCALDALGLDGTHRLEIVLMQLVNLLRDGVPVRMSKRTGKAVSLADLLDEVSVDAARYFFNSRASDTHLDFDLGLAVRQDSENPVYYVQYAHARVMSVLKALRQDGVSTEVCNPDYTLLTEKSELDLIRELSRLPEEIRLAAEQREPSRLTRCAVQTATAFHKFYTECRIKDAEPALRDARIALCACTAAVIENTLSAFGVSAPDHM
ncbi:MAG: arginine--tRNA ligase [Clostridiaceae bacterium]|nr:arginine--tRNA ligase [Clostridiaceae bacterium]